ncbi:hypothetical protein SLUN_32700 [Streptomyces lunaelactis]|uniref:N-acetyltransferase domain-containing protein n=1 Tax=Streptomyces lunaelactis TaxID=1535768 RepID=A0A2R4TAU3_9ACTN|nr:hypothetical protein SLUN_32700 [Streptomyces lunaelactis]NUK89092.1 GNAT family N-acetyltransferase [Streptomyces lunaelactis]
MQIRRALTPDAAGIAAVHVRSWQAAFPGLVPQRHLDALDPAREALAWAGRLTEPRRPAAGVLVAETDEGIVAFAGYAPGRTAGTAEIGALYSLPEVWGTGVGRRLLAAVVQELTAAGRTRASLWVLEANERARRFYEAAGWRPDGAVEVDTTGGRPQIKLRYQLPLLGPVVAEPIRTDRLVLLPLTVEHAREMATVLADPALHTFIGGEPDTPGALRSRYARMLAGAPDPTVSWCNWVISLEAESCLTGTVQATVGLAGRGRTAEIAWLVGTDWQGRGIATEAARGLVGWLARQPVHTAVAHVHPDHLASAAVAAAAGLTPTDRVQDGEVRWEGRLAVASVPGPDLA